MKKLWMGVIIFTFFASVIEARTIKVQLYEVSPVKVVDLKGTSAQYEIKIAIPERWKVKTAILHFGYVNSSALSAQNSRLIVKLNGYPLAQIKLNPITPAGEAKILLPARWLKAGYNDLTFCVFQHYTLEECEDPSAPELWTTLKLDEAFLQIEYTLKSVPLKLSSVSHFLFDPKIFPCGRVNIITEKPSAEMFTVASIIASGIALRFDYRKVIFSTSADIKTDCDNILIGRKEFVEKFLKQKETEIGIKGSFLKIMHLPVEDKRKNKKRYIKDPHHALLVVSGKDLNEVKLAAETIAIFSFPFPDTDKMEPKEISLPVVYPYMGKLILIPGNKYTFNTLGFTTYTFKGMRPSPKNLTFRLPADLLIKPNQYANLYLHLAYGAGMRSDSALNVLLNGQYITAIHLDDPHGNVFSDYKISIPTYLFQRGYNKITFIPVLTPSITGHCEFIQTKNLFFTLFDDSSFYFPSMSHWIDLPRMELFFQDSGFPFTRWPDGRETLLYLTQSDFKTLGAALNLIGIMGQKIGYPLFQIKIDFQKPQNWKGEIIVLGTVNTIPEDLKKLAPLKLNTTTSRSPYPLLKNMKGEISDSLWQKFKNPFLSIVRVQRKTTYPSVAMSFSKQISGLGPDRGVVMEFQSPYEKGRSVLLLTATSAESLEKLSRALLEPAVQANCQGDLALIDFTLPYCKVSALKVGKKYYSGNLGHLTKITIYLHTYFWLFFLLLIILLIFLSLIIFHFLKKYRQKRIKNEKTDSD